MKILSKTAMATLLAFGLILMPFQSADAAVKFKNCKELNKVYTGGVAMSASVKNKGGKTKYKPAVAPKIYSTHKNLDRDKDGIACER